MAGLPGSSSVVRSDVASPLHLLQSGRAHPGTPMQAADQVEAIAVPSPNHPLSVPLPSSVLGLGVFVYLDEWDPRRGRQGRTWRKLVAVVCPPGSLCEMPVCLYPWLDRVIVFGLRRNHPHGPSVDHI